MVVISPLLDKKVNVEELVSWDSLIEKAPEKTKKQYDGFEEPRTLEIRYFDDLDGPQKTEVVFEDPGEGEKRPRLLVSLQSVLALKALCEREFGRVEALAEMLHNCRTAYFKELLWLREQLLIAGRPEYAVVNEAVNAYEVYWYDPPQYVNEELREFMLDCIRHTNRKLIEENYALQMALGGKSLKDYEDPMDTLKRVLKGMGPGKLVKATQGVITSKDNGTPEQVDEFQKAILAIAFNLGWRQPEEPVVVDTKPAVDPKMVEELQALREQVKDMEFLRTRLGQLQAEIDAARKAKEAAEAALAAEAARAQAEKERADAERLRAEQAEADLEKALSKPKEPPPRPRPAANNDSRNFDKLRAAADRATDRIMSCVSQLGKMKAFAGATPSPPASPTSGAAHIGLEQASSALEDLISQGANEPIPSSDQDAAKSIAKLKNAAERLEAKVKSLEEQLKEAREAERRAKEEAAEALKRAEDAARRSTKGSGIDPAELAKMGEAERNATKRAEKAEKQVKELSKKLEEQAEEIAALKREVSRLKRLLEDAGNHDTSDSDEKIRKLQELVKELKAKLAEAEEAYNLLAGKLSMAQDKIRALKDEVKMWKRKCGVEVNSDDESEDEDDLPNFMISYAKRNRNATKPRWAMLSEDATLGRMKREFLFSQKTQVLSSAASSAFKFLNLKPGSSARRKGARSREHSPEAYWQFQAASQAASHA
eukprot:CAMPEP_0115741922 /NCGR_PEP_ID=MMETSP0272-20121206/90256_1 /TAXON_ID=71861 /ORGANISM="Scrippsiella trochoidea, Strain CCMP3099" /LENGTH=712 /DNA_ID=CAMNT_0003186617 /DNA_START=130 /DNA_END=2265 /DNA_ORIENTATION=-